MTMAKVDVYRGEVDVYGVAEDGEVDVYRGV